MNENLTLTNLVELSHHLSEAIESKYKDICEIEMTIEDLNKKKKSIVRSMEYDAKYLRMIAQTKFFRDNVTETHLRDLDEAISGVDDLVKMVNDNHALTDSLD